MDWLTLVVAYAFVFYAVFSLSRMVFYSEEARSAKQLLEEEQTRTSKNFIIKVSRFFFSRYLVPIVSGFRIDKYRKKLKQRIIAAGMAEEFTPDDLVSFKLFLIVGAPVALALGNWLGDFGFEWHVYPGASALGFFYPDYMLHVTTKKRQTNIRKAMPFIVDLLALSTEAGLDFMGAIGKVVEKAKPSPLVEEFEQVLKEIQVGSSRADALREMTKRLNMSEISSFVAILISADQMGASIAKVLRQQSEQIRNQRFLSAERAGAAASQKVILAGLPLILVAIFITIFGPFILQYVLGGGA